LRLRPWYPRWIAVLYGAALLVPVLALVGFGVAGRAVLILSQNREWLAQALAAIGRPAARAQADLIQLQSRTLIGPALLLLRAFTRLSEHRLPFDVVFLLNRYFAEMGHAVERAGGRVDKFIGDGVMALFGIDATPEAGARAALVAARGMAENLRTLNTTLAS